MGVSSNGRSTACALCLLVDGVVLFCLGIWMTTVYASYTPVYTEITCKINDPQVISFSFNGGKLRLGMELTTTCNNPNPYDLIVTSTKAGKVYMNDDMSEVGTVTNIPEVKLPSDGEGTIAVFLEIAPAADAFGSILDIIAANEIPIWVETNMEVKVDAKFLVGSFKTTRPFEKQCVMNWQLQFPETSKMGPMSCADTFAELTPQPIGSSAANTLSFPADSMAGDQIDEATTQKNVGCGLGMAFGYGLGVGFCILGAILFCRARRSTKAAEAKQSQPADVPI